MITCIPKNGVPEDVREITGPYLNYSKPSLGDLINLGRRIYKPDSRRGIITSHWIDDGTDFTEIVDSAKTQEQLDEEDRLAREAAEQARKNAFLPLVPVASSFKSILRKYFGEGAETNKNITETVVSAYFEQKRSLGTITLDESSDVFFLKTYYEKLLAWNGTGETWSLPWDIVP